MGPVPVSRPQSFGRLAVGCALGKGAKARLWLAVVWGCGVPAMLLHYFYEATIKSFDVVPLSLDPGFSRRSFACKIIPLSPVHGTTLFDVLVVHKELFLGFD